MKKEIRINAQNSTGEAIIIVGLKAIEDNKINLDGDVVTLAKPEITVISEITVMSASGKKYGIMSYAKLQETMKPGTVAFDLKNNAAILSLDIIAIINKAKAEFEIEATGTTAAAPTESKLESDWDCNDSELTDGFGSQKQYDHQ